MNTDSDDGLKSPRWISASLSGYYPFVGTVTLDFGPRKTVITGLNGAGKTALLEALDGARRVALGVPWVAQIVDTFECRFIGSANKEYTYSYHLDIEEPDDPLAESGEDSTGGFTWSEKCVQADGQVLWEVVRGAMTKSVNDQTLLLPRGKGLLSAARQEPSGIQSLLRSFRHIRAGIPREERREWIIVQRSPVRRAPRSRVHFLVNRLMLLHDTQREKYDEFVELLRRLRLADSLLVSTLKTVESEETEREQQTARMIMLDGENLGMQSDGTLRIAEIVLSLVDRPELLIIEEPETALHPGLLGRLLSLLDSYSLESQLVVSTHSPQVVTWAAPNELRLVTRADHGSPSSVRGLSPSQASRLSSYLEEGTLGEFLFYGGTDDD